MSAAANIWRAGLLAALTGTLLLVLLLSFASGSKPIPFGEVWNGLFHFDRVDPDHLIIRSLRVPRTVVGGLVGIGLGLAGTLIQGVTRNPLADPDLVSRGRYPHQRWLQQWSPGDEDAVTNAMALTGTLDLAAGRSTSCREASASGSGSR